MNIPNAISHHIARLVRLLCAIFLVILALRVCATAERLVMLADDVLNRSVPYSNRLLIVGLVASLASGAAAGLIIPSGSRPWLPRLAGIAGAVPLVFFLYISVRAMASDAAPSCGCLSTAPTVGMLADEARSAVLMNGMLTLAVLWIVIAPKHARHRKGVE